jgi:hypothetical protein
MAIAAALVVTDVSTHRPAPSPSETTGQGRAAQQRRARCPAAGARPPGNPKPGHKRKKGTDFRACDAANKLPPSARNALPTTAASLETKTNEASERSGERRERLSKQPRSRSDAPAAGRRRGWRWRAPTSRRCSRSSAGPGCDGAAVYPRVILACGPRTTPMRRITTITACWAVTQQRRWGADADGCCAPPRPPGRRRAARARAIARPCLAPLRQPRRVV